MSGRIVGEVLECAPEDLTHLELLVLVAVAEAAHDHDRIAKAGASAEHLAFKVRSTPGTVRNVLSRLRERGLLVPMIDRPRRGIAQNYLVPKLLTHHRGATLGTPIGDAHSVTHE